MGLKLEFLDDPPEKHNSYFHHVLKDDESAINLDTQINFGENCYKQNVNLKQVNASDQYL